MFFYCFDIFCSLLVAAYQSQSNFVCDKMVSQMNFSLLKKKPYRISLNLHEPKGKRISTDWMNAIESDRNHFESTTTDTRTQTNSISFQYAKWQTKRSRIEGFIRQQMMLICFNLNDVIKGSASAVIDFGKPSALRRNWDDSFCFRFWVSLLLLLRFGDMSVPSLHYSIAIILCILLFPHNFSLP